MRDRLIELLNKKYDHFCDQCGVNKDSHYTENLADHLLDNGVIVPPCKVGDTVYQICFGKLTGQKIIKKSKVTAIKITDKITITLNYLTNLCDKDIGYWLFVGENAIEEAEQALKERVKE